MSYTKEDILRIVEEEEIEFIRMQFVDIFGQLKNVAITASQTGKALNNQIMFDGSSIEGFTRVNESDQYLFPDRSSFAIFPWRPAQGRVARLICDVYDTDGTPFVGDPRGVLRRVVRKARDMGFDAFNIGPELEFFLFETDEEGRATTRTGDQAGYFDLGPLDQGESTRREICRMLEEMGYEIEASHHESAAGQHEIDFKYVDAMDAADKIMTFKLAVKTIAQKNGLHATFMPKPLFGAAGSGMHLNMSLFRDGKNLFYDPADPRGLSQIAYSFIAGLLEHVKGFTALTNPLVNSYKRLVSGYEAPCYKAWSASNRSALIRIPASRGSSTRVELRSPDPACNPYLAIGLVLAAGLDGIENRMVLSAPVNKNLFDPSMAEGLSLETLPASLEEAVQAAEESEFLRRVLPEQLASRYFTEELKRCEALKHASDPVEYERTHYFNAI